MYILERCLNRHALTYSLVQELADFIPRALIQIREAIHKDTIVYISKDHITNVLNTVEYDKPFQILGVNFLVTSSSKYKTIVLKLDENNDSWINILGVNNTNAFPTIKELKAYLEKHSINILDTIPEEVNVEFQSDLQHTCRLTKLN